MTDDQIHQLVDFIRQLASPVEIEAGGPPSFTRDVLPILAAQCGVCHGTLGGWDASSHETVMATGEHAPVVIPGDPENSLLAKKLLGTHEQGTLMPPSGALPAPTIQIILDWIAAGAPDN